MNKCFIGLLIDGPTCLLSALGLLRPRGAVQRVSWILTPAHKSGHFSKAKIRFQSFFMLMTNQPSFFASS